MIPFDDVVLPETLVSGSAGGGPQFAITVMSKRTGVEHRIANVKNQQHAFDVTPVVKTDAAFNTLVNFIASRNGSARGFRFRDWADYSTAADDVGDPTSGTSSGIVTLENGEYRLYKRYDDGNGYTYDRRITKARASSFVLKSGGSVVSSGYTLSDTGVLSFSGSPPASLTWNGYFEVPVHFASGSEEVIGMTYDDFRQVNTSLSLQELQVFDGSVTWHTDTPSWPVVPSGGGGPGPGPGGGGPGGGTGGGGSGGGKSPEDDADEEVGTCCVPSDGIHGQLCEPDMTEADCALLGGSLCGGCTTSGSGVGTLCICRA